MSESTIQRDIRLALGSDPDVVFWRNNCGVATFGRTKVRYGLAVGSSDLIGSVCGRFAALEVKSATGRAREEQERYLALVRKKGGFAAIVRSPAEALAAVARCKAGASE